MDVLKRLADSVVVPVVVLEKAEDAIPTANAMLAGGIDTMEITFRTACAADAIKAVSEKLEVVNLQLARRTAMRRNALHWAFILAGAVVVLGFVVLVELGSPYADWDYGDPETAVFGATFHAFEWLFVRLAPIALVGALGGAILTRKKA